MKKKLLISELNRMREMMGLNLISETRLKSLITEGDGIKSLATLGLGGKSVDNLTKAGIDAAADLSKLSDEFAILTGKQNPTMDDFLKIVSDSLKKNSDELTDAEVTAYVKSNEKLYNSILKKASDEATRIVDNLMKNMSLKKFFDNAGIPQVYDNLKTLTSVVPTKENVTELMKDLDNHIAFVKDLLDDNPGNKELEEIAAQLAGKKEDCVKFKGESVSLSPNIAKLFAEINLIKEVAKEFGITATDEMITVVKNFIGDIGDTLFGKMTDDLQSIPAGGGPIPSGNIWRKLEPFYKMEYNSYGGGNNKFNNFMDGADRVGKSAGKFGEWVSKWGLRFVFAILAIVTLIGIYKSCQDGSAKKALIETGKEIIDLTLTPDTKFEDCIENLPGYSELTNDQKKYSAIYVACDENCLGFSKISETKFQIGFKGNPTCLETHVINTGGLSGVKESGNCKGGSNTTGGKKYTCKDNACVEDPNGEFNESTCGGSCGGNEEEEETTVEVGYTNDLDGWVKYAGTKSITNPAKTTNDTYYGFLEGNTVKGTYGNGTWTHQ
jgi:hypothetical protein